MPRFLHSTAKITRHLIEHVPDDPLTEQGSTKIGAPDLSHIPIDGQSRVRVGGGMFRRRGSSFYSSDGTCV